MKVNKHPFFIAACFTAFMYIHHAVVPSGVNGVHQGLNLSLKNLWENENAEEILRWRWHHPVFSKRPVTTGIQKILEDKVNIPAQFSFNLITAVALLLSGIIISLITIKILGQNHNNTRAQILFYLSFPVLFSFYPRINSYDDPLQYLFILLTIYLLFDKKLLLSVFTFSLACLVRETSLLFYPLFLIHVSDLRKVGSLLRFLFIMAIPVTCYLIAMTVIAGPDSKLISTEYLLNRRFYFWRYNFSDLYKTFETFYTLIITAGIPLFVIFIRRFKFPGKLDKFIYFSKVIFLLNTLIVLISARAREGRLFFLPVLLFIPLLPYYFNYVFTKLKSYKLTFERYFTTVLILSLGLAFLYDPDIGYASYFFKFYGFSYTLTLGILILLELKWLPEERKITGYPS